MSKIMEKLQKVENISLKKWHSGLTWNAIFLVIFWCTCDEPFACLRLRTKRSWNFLILSWDSLGIERFRKSTKPGKVRYDNKECDEVNCLYYKMLLMLIEIIILLMCYCMWNRIEANSPKISLLHKTNLDPDEEGCVVDMKHFDTGM